ncbi:hypothetical protein EXS65_02790 [Candidatus Peribacteria bacterium]|nr:hypothetical protein [Candidatus Peribacteria bacterium]
MKNFFTVSVCASALMLAACSQQPVDNAMPVPDDAMMQSSEAMMQSSAMMDSSEDAAMMKVEVDAMMKSSEDTAN